MIEVSNIEVWGFEHAIRGMRNPMNSWSMSDSRWVKTGFKIGKNDMELMQTLFKAGTEHRKYLRQIFVSMDIVAPLYWCKETDQYKVGTVTNSCSTMHRITAKEFTLDDFSHEHLTFVSRKLLERTIVLLNNHRRLYLDYDDMCEEDKESLEAVISCKKDIWWQIIQLLPSSYNQRRTITMNYENVFSIIKQRTGHKLDEWNEFVKILKTLPYVKEIGGYEEK